MSAISVRKFPREHHHAHQERHTAKVVLARGYEYISKQMLVADIHGRLKDLDVHGIYQTGKSYIWYIEFNKEEDMRTFIKVPAMVIDNYTASISALNEQRTTVKIFWLPTYIRESFVRSFLAPYGKVMDVTRERVMLEQDKYCMGGTYSVEMVLSDRQKDEIPYLVKYDVGISMLITMAGRPPLCLKCNNIGHIRKNCPENLPRPQVSGTYAAAAARRDNPVQREVAKPPPPPPPQPPSTPPVLPAEPESVPIYEYSVQTSKPPKTGRSVPPDQVPSMEDLVHKDNEEAEAEAEIDVSLSDKEDDASTSTLGGVTALPQSPVEPSSLIFEATSSDQEDMEATSRTTGLKRKTADYDSIVRNIAAKYVDDDIS